MARNRILRKGKKGKQAKTALLHGPTVYQFFPPGALFGPFFQSLVLFSEHQRVNHCLSVSISSPWYVFKFTISKFEKREMIVIHYGETSSVADRSGEQELRPKQNENIASPEFAPVVPVRKIAFWIERTLLVRTFFSFDNLEGTGMGRAFFRLMQATASTP